jgi:asparagine synthase (glutamine-hydrolysing)
LTSSPAFVDTILNKSFSKETGLWKDRKSDMIKHIGLSGLDMNDVMQSDFNTVLSGDMLYKTDMMSMANGIEVRVPFLDHRLVDFTMSLPSEYKIDKDRRKKIARDAFGSMLPPEVLHRKKKGFDVPVEDYLYKSDVVKSFFNELMQGDFIKEQGIFEPAFAEAMIPSRNKKLKVDAELWWAYVVFQNWYRKYNT